MDGEGAASRLLLSMPAITLAVPTLRNSWTTEFSSEGAMKIFAIVATAFVLAGCTSPTPTCGVSGLGAFATDRMTCAVAGGTYFGADPAYLPADGKMPAPAAVGRCREYQTTIMVGGEPAKTWGHACQRPDGSWEVIGG